MSKPSTRMEFYCDLESFQTRFNSMQPELEVSVRDPALKVEGHVVVWNTAVSKDGPLPYCGKGGTRIRDGLNLEEVKMLARMMAIKNAAAGLPLGGSKSGMNADPRSPGFEPRYRRFVELCKPFLHENGGVFGGFGFDIGAAPEHAVWACDALGSRRSFTGKTVEMGGTDYNKEGIAGLGVAEAAAALMLNQGEKPNTASFAVQGVGAMGAAVVRYFSEYGATLAAIADPKYGGTWRFEQGVSKELLSALFEQRTDEVAQLIASEGRLISDQPNQVLFEAVDVLFPCALHSVITLDNAENVKARFLSEGANSPCDLAAYPLLYSKGVQLIPDFIANCGGIIAAFVELTSKVSAQENIRTRAKVNEAKAVTRAKIKENISRIASYSESFGVPFRDAGLYVALNSILHG